MIIASFAQAEAGSEMAEGIEYLKEKVIGKDFTGDMFTYGSVKMSAINADVMAKGTSAKLAEEIRKIQSCYVYDDVLGEYVFDPAMYIFDCSKFTIKSNSAVKDNVIYQTQTQEDGSKVDVAIGTTDDEGRILTYKADVEDKGDFKSETEVIKAGVLYDPVTHNPINVNYFSESTFRSAPYFDLTIDGIKLLNTKF